MFALTFFNSSTVFYGGELISIRNLPTTVALDGTYYVIDLTQYEAGGLPSFRSGVVASEELNDNLFDPTAGWWRYGFSWIGGAGQKVRDLGETNLSRYYSSVGIDPWTQYEACLLNSTETIRAATSGQKIAVTSGFLYLADGTSLYRTADLTSWSTMTGTSGVINDLTSDGVNVYACTDSQIYECVPGSTAVNTITPTGLTNQFDYIHFAGNYLLVSDGDLLRDASKAALSTLWDHFQDGFRWTVAFNIGSRVYAGGYAGNRSQIFTTASDENGDLVLSAEAADFFADELINDAISYGGAVLLGTNRGIRYATLSADGTLTYGPLIEAPGNVTSVFAEGQFAWFSWQNHASGKAGIGRLSLGNFVDTLQPAYASDVYSSASNANETTSVVRFLNRTIFGVENTGLFGTVASSYVQSGTIEIGELYFGTVEDKSLMEFQARCAELAANESMEIELFDGASGASIKKSLINSVGSTGVVADAQGRKVNQVKITITLNGDGTSSPCLRQWRGRAYPIVPSGELWIVPLMIVSSTVGGDGEGQVLTMNPWEQVELLKEKRRSRQIVTYQEGNHAFRVRIENFKVEPRKWTRDGDWLEVLMTLTLISV